jgi:xanthine dehydrogenase molybdopterin-binding subunit B
MSKEIEYTIRPDGTVEFDLQGFKGQGCSETAEQIIKKLGKDSKRERKQEYYQKDQVRINQSGQCGQ